MSIQHISTLTLEYLTADSGEIGFRKIDLEEYLRAIGNSESQITNWMGYCLNLDGDEDGDLLSVISTDITLLAMEGSLVVSKGEPSA